jgi:hypothetical protein
VFPIFVLFRAGFVQFRGFILWGQNTLYQVVRDTGPIRAGYLFDMLRPVP